MPSLYPFQEIGAAWLSTKRTACLADDMGLGKTNSGDHRGGSYRREKHLIICPVIAPAATGRDWYRLLGYADTPEKLQEIAEARGYKRGWVGHILAERHRPAA